VSKAREDFPEPLTPVTMVSGVVGDLEVHVLQVVNAYTSNNDALLLSQLSGDNHKRNIIPAG
jgi:hypothetical protein